MNYKRLVVIAVSVIVVLYTLPALPMMPARAQDDSGSYWPTEGWRTATPEEQGMSSVELAALVNYVADPTQYADSMIVIRHGYIVAEAYFAPVTMDEQHYLYSSSKSVISALIGIAIEQGLIPGIDARLVDLYADHTITNLDQRKEAITVEHLLNMTSGFECNEDAVYAGDDWVQAALDMPMVAEPGTEFLYCNPNTTMLSGLINQTTGMSALEFANEYLFGPMGITDAQWTADAHNVNFGASELLLTPRDMAKFGYLYLHQGEWEGQQLVPAEWVTVSTSTQFANAFPGFDYGYQWWTLPSINAYFAVGFAGQYIWVYPDKDLVFVVTSGIPDPIRISHQAAPLIGQLLMLTTSEEALPENAVGVAELEASVNAVSQPQAQEVPELPAMAATVSGQTYNLLTTDLLYGLRLQVRIPPGEADSWFDTQALVLAFDESAEAVLTLTFVDGTTATIPIGLDGLYRRSENRLGLVAACGAWIDDNTFQVYLKLVRDSTEYRLDMRFEQELVEIIDYEIDDGAAGAIFGLLVPPTS